MPVANAVAPRADAPGKVSLSAVNGWRGPGAIAIAIGHLGIATDFFVVRHLEPIALLVDLFFVLSGLLIAQVYTEKLSKASAIPEYIIRRFGRIWPVQAATLAVLILYELVKFILQTYAGKHFSSPAFGADGINLPQAITTNLLLIHSLGIHDRETWNFPSWSLSVEFATYAVFALFCLVTPLMRRVLAVATVAASIAILMLVAPFHMRSTFDYGIFRCLAGFFAGTLCYDVLRNWRLPKWPLPTLVEILAIVMVGVWMSYFNTYLAFAAPLVFCLFIVAFVQERGLLSRVLSTKPFQFMAELSFSIYMVHALVLIFALAFFHELERMTGVRLFVSAPNPLAGHPGTIPTIQILHVDSAIVKWAIGAAYLSCVLLIAYAAYRFVETPGRAFFGMIAKRFGKAPSKTQSKTQSTAPSRAMPQVHAGREPMEPAP